VGEEGFHKSERVERSGERGARNGMSPKKMQDKGKEKRPARGVACEAIGRD